MILPPKYLNGAVAIGTDDSEGTKRWIASGVLFVEPTEDTGYPFLVTNKHVIEGLETMYVRLNPTADGPALEAALTLRGENNEPFWYPHPDPDVDIAVTPLDPDFIQGNELEMFFFDG